MKVTELTQEHLTEEGNSTFLQWLKKAAAVDQRASVRGETKAFLRAVYTEIKTGSAIYDGCVSPETRAAIISDGEEVTPMLPAMPEPAKASTKPTMKAKKEAAGVTDKRKKVTK